MEKREIGKKKRVLSKFICQELLYDYTMDSLDDERTQAIEDCFLKYPDIKKEEREIRHALEFCSKLNKTKIALPLLEIISEDPNWFSIVKRSLSWKSWPEPFKWASEALLISSLVATLSLFIPWEKINFFNNDDEVVLSEGEKVKFPENQLLNSEIAANKPVEPEVESKPTTDSKAAVTVPDVAKTNVAIKVPEVPVVETPQPFDQVDERKSQTDTLKPAKKVASYLYRAFMNSTSVDSINPEIIKFIIDNGGLKAGQVELGWRKPNGSYYHFSYPEEKFEDLIAKLKTFSEVSVEKSEHSRVMPKGKIRIILWIEQKSEQ